jgi:hypothetical protein
MKLYTPEAVAEWFPGEKAAARQRVYYLVHKGVLTACTVGGYMRILPPTRIIGAAPVGKNPFGATDEELAAWSPTLAEFVSGLPVQLTPREVSTALSMTKDQVRSLRLPWYSPEMTEEVLLLRCDLGAACKPYKGLRPGSR